MKIITYPNEILSNKSVEVAIPLSSDVKELVREMYKTVKDKGVGLAAPQVGINKQICIILLDPEMRTKKRQRP